MIQASFDAQLASIGPLLFYVIAFLVMYVENGIMLGFFLPGDSLLFVAGALWATAGMDVLALMITLTGKLYFFAISETFDLPGRKSDANV